MSSTRQSTSPPREVSVVSRIARWLAVAPIAVYQRVLSPFLPRRCKYEPTCSHYAIDAIGEYGILRGAVLALWRLLRCNPWSYGGYDPVEDQRLFKDGRASTDPGERTAPTGPHPHRSLNSNHSR